MYCLTGNIKRQKTTGRNNLENYHVIKHMGQLTLWLMLALRWSTDPPCPY